MTASRIRGRMLARRPQLVVMVLLITGIVIGVEPVPVVRAANPPFTVTKAADTNDGACDADCSLREAVIAANALAGNDTIVIPAGIYTLAIGGIGEEAAATGDLDISDSLTITGADAATTIIDGGALDRIFHVQGTGAVTVTISNVTIRNGDAAGIGGGLANINSASVLIILNSAIVGNTAAGNGGGIFNTGTLSLTHSTILSNTTTSSGHGIGIYNSGTLTVTTSILSGNLSVAGDGGGIYNGAGTLMVVDSTISGNQANSGGGINVDAGATTIVGSSIISNTAAIFSGGGIRSKDTTTLVNSTLSGNQANENGGGLRNTMGAMTLTNVTITDNTADPAFQGGGMSISGTVTLKNSIIANNVPVNCASTGTITDGGSNLDSGATCLSGGTSSTNVDPLLGLLQDNGGPTLTHALLPGSPAIDAGNNSICAAALVNNLDQRGITRPQGSTCDVGAYENTVPTISDITNQTIAEDASTGVLAFTVGDAETAAANLTLSKASSNPALVPVSNIVFGGSGTSRTVTVMPAANLFGMAVITVTVNDGNVAASDPFTVTVTAVADTPSATNATTAEDTQSTSGLVISRNVGDGGEVTHFKVTGITNGTLYENDGTTSIAAGSFITFAVANAGLRFTPAANFGGTGSFTVQASTSASDAGLGGSTVTANITVTAVNDAPVNTVPGTQNTITGAALVFSSGNGNQMSLADLDAGSNPIRVTLTATNGTITLATTTGLAFSAGDGTGDATMTFTGTSAAINAALNGLSVMPTIAYGTASLQIVTNDQGSSGSGGALSDTDTVSITVTPYFAYLPLVMRQP